MKAQIETPLGVDDPSKIKVEEIPLPPEHLWAELDNSGKAPVEQPAEPAPQTNARREVAALNFTRPTSIAIPLEFPFGWEGREVDAITVRRLTTAEVGDLIDTLPRGRTDNFDIYAVMTGLPAPVLRGLIEVDGEPVTRACYDFLPLVFRPAAESPST